MQANEDAFGFDARVFASLQSTSLAPRAEFVYDTLQTVNSKPRLKLICNSL